MPEACWSLPPIGDEIRRHERGYQKMADSATLAVLRDDREMGNE